MAIESPQIDFRKLTSGGRVHGSLYRDPAIFKRELDQIWNKVWVYIGHDSEVPKPGDYVRRQIGLQPVIMLRGEDGKVRVLFNRCRHRGNLMCHHERGNAEVLRCPYHGWTYDLTGAMLDPTFEEGYDHNLDRSAFGLTPVPRQGSYRGMVFASASPTGITLEQHLGPMTEYIDLIIDLSPVGEVDINTGTQKLRYKGNWKLLPENSLEGDYHGPFIHRIAFELHGRRSGLDLSSLYQNEIPDVIRSLPGGHMVEDYRGATMAAPKKLSPARQQYAALMEQAYGSEKARQLLGTIPPLIYIFPNFIFIMTHFRRIQPVSVNETFVYYQPMFLKGVPDQINLDRLREHEFGFGPAGMISPDDVEIMERNQIGVEALGEDWQFIGRGMHRDKHLPDGGQAGYTMDECHIRGTWEHYGRLMSENV